MRNEALVNGEDALGVDRLSETVEDAVVQVTMLIVQARHDGI